MSLVDQVRQALSGVRETDKFFFDVTGSESEVDVSIDSNSMGGGTAAFNKAEARMLRDAGKALKQAGFDATLGQYGGGLTVRPGSNGSGKYKIGDDVVVAKGPYRSGAVGKVTTVPADGKTVRVKFGASPESESFPVSQVRLAGQ